MSTVHEIQTPGIEALAPEPNESCDRCSAHAAVAVELTVGRLVFCRHHFDEAMTKPKFNDQLLSTSPFINI